MEMSRDNVQKRTEAPYTEKSPDDDQKRYVYKYRNTAQDHSFTFFHRNKKTLLSATSILSRSPMAYNTTASLDKLTCTDYVDFGKCQDRFRRFFFGQKRFQLLGCKTQSIQERRQERVPTGPKSYNGRNRFQPVCDIEESAGQCSKKLC